MITWSGEPLKVFIADDHGMMRDGLRSLLEHAGIEVVGEAANGRDAVREAKRLLPDILILDIGMPELNGIDAARRLSAELPQTKLLGLSVHCEARYAAALLEAGAAGYVVKNAASGELLEALAAIARGEGYVSAGLVGPPPSPPSGPEQAPGSRRTPLPPKSERGLTAREREVLQLIAEGKSSKQIAGSLGIAVATVETHRRQLMVKLNLRSIAELTKYAIREGITSLDG